MLNMLIKWIIFDSTSTHKIAKKINLITMYYNDSKNSHLSVNFRVYDKSVNKTKNDYFLEMIDELITGGLQSASVTDDS